MGLGALFNGPFISFSEFKLCYAHIFFSFQNRRFLICISFSFWMKEKPSVLKQGFHKIWKQKCASVLFTYVSPLSSKVRVMLGGIHKLLLQVLTFFGHLPPSAYIFYGKKVYKKTIVLTTYPPPLVNVVCERPLRLKLS